MRPSIGENDPGENQHYDEPKDHKEMHFRHGDQEPVDHGGSDRSQEGGAKRGHTHRLAGYC